MPPKPQGKKTGDVEDFSDLATLPAANVFKFTVINKTFFSLENREKVTKRIQENLVPTSTDKIKMLTREEIMTTGKAKGTIVDAAALAGLSPDDPRRNIPEEDQVARAAADRIFEMTVAIRRVKKEKMVKLEEEAAAKATEDQPAQPVQADNDQVDGMILLLDYPQSKAEAFALSRHSYSLNGVFEVNEVPKADADEQENEDEEEAGSDEDEEDEADQESQKSKKAAEEEQKQEMTPDSEETQTQMQAIIDQFMIARSLSAANSNLRQMAFMKVNFRDEAKTTESKDAEGQTVQKVRSSEDAFLQDLFSFHIDKYAQYFVQYLKFRELVTVEPLMVDKEAIEEIKKLEKLTEKQNVKLEENEIQLEEEINQIKEDAQEGAEAEAATDSAQQQAKQRAEDCRQEVREQQQMIQNQMKKHNKRKRVSLDDERDYSQFKLDAYQNDFVDNSETANNVQSVLSAMITQIEVDNKWVLAPSQVKSVGGVDAARSEIADDTTQAESLDDLFDEFHHDVQCGLKLKDRGADPVGTKSIAETLSSRHNRGIEIHEENDKTLEVQQSLPLALVETEADRVRQIGVREREVLKNLNLPGKDRYLMPAIPTKSVRQREAENPGFYPFCTLPITDAERMLLLKQFQQLIRQNFVDQGAKGAKRADKDRVFNRTYENHMTPEIFRQVFSDALIDEPDAASLYYPRKDALLVALYNKTTRKVPQAGAKPMSPPTTDTNEPDGERAWRAAYRVMPDFQNWITFFADEIVFEQEVAVPIPEPEQIDPKVTSKDTKGKGAAQDPAELESATALTVNIMKYAMDEDLLPERMLDIEDDKVQNIAEKTVLLYPDDNSTMRVDHFTVGGKTFSKSIVVKDNLKFGLRPRDQSDDDIKQQVQSRRFGEKIDEDAAPSEGLVQYKSIGDTEFWLNFENGTKMGVEQVQLKRNPYKIIRTDPDPPTAEDILRKEEAIKAQQAQLAKQRTVKPGGVVPPEIEIPKTPEPTFQEKELNHLDTLFTDQMLTATQSVATLTLKNGLIVQLLGSGEVCQIHDTELDSAGKDGKSEANRLITRDGVVIRQMHNRDSEVLYPDGVVARFSKTDMEWIVTNNKGKRTSYKDNQNKDLAPIPCACETDAVTNAKMMIREDNVCTVTYKDGSLFVQHSDGTQMHTSADGLEVRIERPGYAQHTIRRSTSEQIQGTNTTLKSIQERSIDHKVLETYLPDGSKVQSILDSVDHGQGKVDTIRHIIRRSDLSVIMIDSEGNVSLISSNARSALNDAGGKNRFDQEERDCDYLAELVRGPGQFIHSVYQAHISAQPNSSTIKTKNSQDHTVFTLTNEHELSKHVTTVPQYSKLSSGPAKYQDEPMSKKRGRKTRVVEPKEELPKLAGDLEMEDVGGWLDPHQKYYQYPRLFVIQNDGNAKELLSAPQLDYPTRQKKVQIDQSIKQKMSDVFNNSSLQNHYYLTKVINMKQRELEQQKLTGIEFPENAATVLQKFQESPEISLLIPKQEQYLFSQIFQLPDCDMIAQEIFTKDFQNYVRWKMGQLRYDTEFAIVHLPVSKDQPVNWVEIADEEYANKKICSRILKHRAQPGSVFEAEEFKKSAMKSMATSGDIANFRQKTRDVVASRGGSRGASRGDTVSKPNSQQSARSKTGSQNVKVRANNNHVRKSRDSSLSTGSNPLSEEADHKLNSTASEKLTAKEKAEIAKEQSRQVVMQNKLTEDRTQKRQEQIINILNQRDQKKNTPDFVDKYFVSFSGNQFLARNPPEPPTEEVMTRMKQRIERSGKERQGDAAGQAYDSNENGVNQGASIEAGSNQQRSNDLVMVGEGMDDKDNPIVALEPDDNLKQGSAFMGSKKAGNSIGPGEASLQEGEEEMDGDRTLPSLYMQEKMYLYNKEQETLLKAEEHHIVKTKDFNVYGRLREDQLKVKALSKSKAASELNEKFITTECITDRRIKGSSMANRYYMNAPSVENVRKQGQHQMILSAINKKQTFAELINQANSMVTGVLHDGLKRSLNILPSSIVFGGLRPGSSNDIIVTIKNEDMVGHRITIKPVADKRILVRQEEFGIIAPGMMKKVIVTIRVSEDEQVPANIKDTLVIMSKHDIFKLPISAKLLSEDEWDEENKQQMTQTGRPIQNSRVRERLNRAIAQSRQSNRSEGPELLTKKPKGVDESLKSDDNNMGGLDNQVSKSMVSGDITDPSRM